MDPAGDHSPETLASRADTFPREHAMPSAVEADEAAAEAARRLPRGMSRRALLRVAGGLGLAAAATPLVGALSQILGAEPAAAAARHRWTMVIDLRSCDGCRGCTTACQQAHYLEPDQEWIKVFELRDDAGAPYFMPRPCMQCQDPPCLRVCPTGATFANADGLVLVDQSRCIGCRMCMAACPYEARYFNWSEPTVAPPLPTTPTPEHPSPQRKGTVGKCIFCVGELATGELPACVAACPMKALWIGDLNADVATNGEQTVRLSSFLVGADAVRFKAELNTRPSVYYVLGHGQNLAY